MASTPWYWLVLCTDVSNLNCPADITMIYKFDYTCSTKH